MKHLFVAAMVFGFVASSSAGEAAKRAPNIVIVMADDMGWRDTGYNGNKIVKTPHLDEMAAKTTRFNYFYPGGHVCSPGRYSLMTGRTPMRCGLSFLGPIRPQETTIARALCSAGYRTALFGKWHLGTGATTPLMMGFDQATWSLNYYDIGGKLRIGDSKETIEVQGDSSLFTMDLALDFIRKEAHEKRPFFAYVAFGSPHAPHVAAPEFKGLYQNLKENEQNFWGEISGLDAAMGKLRAELRNLGIDESTIVIFTSDNGGITPESMDPSGRGKQTVGCRIPALLEWPAVLKQPRQIDMPCGHVDIYPTLLEITGVKVEKQPVLDGVSLVPLLTGKMTERPTPLGFMLWPSQKIKDKTLAQIDFTKDAEGVWIDGKYKLIAPGRDVSNDPVQLYDIFADQAHKMNLAEQQPDTVTRMRADLDRWRRSVRDSYDGKDFK
jgi:arylsulfatase A-like enzyme